MSLHSFIHSLSPRIPKSFVHLDSFIFQDRSHHIDLFLLFWMELEFQFISMPPPQKNKEDRKSTTVSVFWAQQREKERDFEEKEMNRKNWGENQLGRMRTDGGMEPQSKAPPFDPTLQQDSLCISKPMLISDKSVVVLSPPPPSNLFFLLTIVNCGHA